MLLEYQKKVKILKGENADTDAIMKAITDAIVTLMKVILMFLQYLMQNSSDG